MMIIKRDGRFVKFDGTKIENAIKKAFKELDIDEKDIPKIIATHIEQECYTTIKTVEEIQNEVELQLMKYEPEVAKAYILYREERRKIRLKKDKLINTVWEKSNAKTKSIVNANANVDECSFSGRKKEASDEVQKELALSYEITPYIAKAHRDGYIYQHDLSEYEVGSHNCLNIDFKHIFENGFSTRNGDVRPPASFSSACQLVAVAFQCQSQVQFGGVGTVHIDYDLAPFVKMSFSKHFKDGLKFVENVDEEYINTIPKELSVSEITKYKKAYDYAIYMLEREGRQAAQGLYHNLNTLESRQGSQVPFTSINFGRDTSEEGRMISRWMLEASLDGIGKNHSTSIFPISIFQYKKGVNANKDDINYDLKQLALKSLSKRIYPNWVNGDWSEAHEDNDNPDTYFSTMGKW